MKRKSNFDVPPADIPPLSGPAPSEIARIIASFGLENSISQAGLPESVVSVYPPKFKLRLEKAMEKNLEYVRRLDAGEITASSQSAGARAPRPANTISQLVARPGIGSARETPRVAQEKKCSAYVAGLPLDITEAEIAILFSKIAAIRKIKIYKDSTGAQKGDALVTYAKPEAVPAACIQFKNLDIGDGFVLDVSPADYDAKATSTASPQDTPVLAGGGFLSTVSALSSGTALQRGARALPEECEAQHYPVVLIHNVYRTRDIKGDADQFYSELEADMLLECCQMGTVRRIFAGHASLPEGVVCVTFESETGATKCASKMSGRWFDGCQLETKLYIPECVSNQNFGIGSNNDSNYTSTAGSREFVAASGVGSTSAVAPAGYGAASPVCPVTEGDCGQNEPLSAEIVQDVEQVEDFLNSLL